MLLLLVSHWFSNWVFIWDTLKEVSNIELKWNVIIGDFNHKDIETYNIFDHGFFKEYCDKAWKNYKNDFNSFSKEVKRNLMYYFWGKCEWEVIVSHWPPSERFNDKKIDVCEQVMMNWDIFIIYLWNYYYLKSTRKKDIRANLHVTKKEKYISNFDFEEEFEEI